MNDLESLRSKLIEKKQSGFEMTGFRSEINVYSWTSVWNFEGIVRNKVFALFFFILLYKRFINSDDFSPMHPKCMGLKSSLFAGSCVL